MDDLVYDCFKPRPLTLKQVFKADKPNLTKPGLARNLAIPNPGKPVKIFHRCNTGKPGPQKQKPGLTRVNPGAP